MIVLLPGLAVYLLMGEGSGIVLLMKTLLATLLVGILWFGLADEIKWRLNLYSDVDKNNELLSNSIYEDM